MARVVLVALCVFLVLLAVVVVVAVLNGGPLLPAVLFFVQAGPGVAAALALRVVTR